MPSSPRRLLPPLARVLQRCPGRRRADCNLQGRPQVAICGIFCNFELGTFAFAAMIDVYIAIFFE
jgi:hypothetical protein